MVYLQSVAKYLALSLMQQVMAEEDGSKSAQLNGALDRKKKRK